MAVRWSDHELDGAGVLVADVAGQRERAIAQGRSDLGRDAGRRRLLEDLLVAPLDRAVAVTQVHDVAVVVADDLDLDVATSFEVRLDEHRAVAERRQRLARRRRNRVVELVRRAHDAHAPSAAAGSGLDERRVRTTVEPSMRPSTTRSSTWSARPLRAPHASPRPCRRAASSVRASGRPRSGRRRCTGRRERSVLGEEAVAGMDRIAAGRQRRGDHRRRRAGTTRPASHRRERSATSTESTCSAFRVGARSAPRRCRCPCGGRSRDAHGDLAAVRDERTAGWSASVPPHAVLGAALHGRCCAPPTTPCPAPCGSRWGG